MLQQRTAHDRKIAKIADAEIEQRTTYTNLTIPKFHFVGGGTAGGYGIRLTEDINEYLLIAILNSKVIQWFIRQFASPFQGGFYAYNKSTLGESPLPKNYGNKEDLGKKLVISINSLNDEIYQKEQMLLRYLSSKFKLQKVSKKLQNWNSLKFSEFLKELNKAIKINNKVLVTEGREPVVTLTKKGEFEWLALFEEKKKEAQEIQNQIDQTEKEIDQMVYELYGLTEKEIAIIENN